MSLPGRETTQKLMSKKVAVLPTWFWPDRVARTIGVPRFYLEEVFVEKWADKEPTRVAVIAGGEAITYGALRDQTSRTAGLIGERIEKKEGRVLIAAPSRRDALLLFLAALQARCLVQVLPAARPEDIALFTPDLLIVDGDRPPDLDAARISVLTSGEALRCATPPAAARGPVGMRDAAVALPARDGLLALHSHYGLLAGAVSFSTFMEMPEAAVMLLSHPLWSWAGLYSVLATLYVGGTVVVEETGDASQWALAVERHRVHGLFLTDAQAAALTERAAKKTRSALQKSCRWVFVAVQGPFSARHRKKLRTLLGLPILTVYGLPETGPIAASHPSWYIDEAVGIPLTNAELRPVDPRSGQPVEVPWELVEFAAIEVKTPQMMLGYNSAQETQQRLRRRWFFTGALAAMDANGMYYLL